MDKSKFRLVRRKNREGWYVRWTENGRSRERATGIALDRRADAEAWAERLIADLAVPDKPSVGALIDAYLNARLPLIDAPDDLRARCALLKRRHGAKMPTDSFHDGRRNLSQLKAVLHWAARQGHIPVAPHIDLPRRGKARDRFLTREELKRLWMAAERPHTRLAIMLMAATGARVGAVCQLTWDRVDLDRGIIDFNTPDRPATRKRRPVVPVAGEIRAALADAYLLRTTDYVLEYRGKPVDRIIVGFKRAAAAAGLDGVTPHVLKHTAISLLADSGYSVQEISAFTNTTEAVVTAVYLKTNPAKMRPMADALGGNFGGVIVKDAVND